MSRIITPAERRALLAYVEAAQSLRGALNMALDDFEDRILDITHGESAPTEDDQNGVCDAVCTDDAEPEEVVARLLDRLEIEVRE